MVLELPKSLLPLLPLLLMYIVDRFSYNTLAVMQFRMCIRDGDALAMHIKVTECTLSTNSLSTFVPSPNATKQSRFCIFL